jgi:hypothetical protein
METPLMMATGCPLEVTKTDPMTHMPLMQGPLPAGGTKAQPAI